MTVELPISSAIQDARREAIDDSNRWRGHCIELFARADGMIAAALSGEGLTSASLAGRVDALKKQASSEKLTQTLDALREMIEVRNLLAHAVSKVWIEDHRGWLWAYRFRPAGKGKTDQRGYWSDAEAREFEDRLRRTVQRLASYLSREVVDKTPLTKP